MSSAIISDLYGFANPKTYPGTRKSPVVTDIPQDDPGDPTPAKDKVSLGKRDASWMTDAIAVAQFAGSGFLYNSAAKEAAQAREETPPLSDVPEVKLEDPLLIAPGWTTKPEKFEHIVDHLLSSGQNGERAVYLREGIAYSDKACTQETEIANTDRVFVAIYDHVLSPPQVTGPQLETATAMIKEKVSPKVDVLGYSMGGIAVRKMLDSGEESVDQIAFLGTPHEGTRFADLADYVIRRDINFAMNLAGVDATHLPTMAWMKPENPQLEALNETLDRQKAQTTEMVNIGSDGLATITKPWGGTEGGDGLVQRSALDLEGVPTVVLPGRGNKQHGALPSDSDVFTSLMDFFDWQAVQEVAS